MTRRITAFVLSLLVLAGNYLYAGGADEIKMAQCIISFAKEPVLDGTIGDSEWNDAVKIDLKEDQSVFLSHDSKTLHLSFAGTQGGIGTIYILNGDRIHILHASYALGTAVYKRNKNSDKWTLEKGFTWKKNSKSCWTDDGWTASTIPDGKQMHMEFSISFNLLGIDPDLKRNRKDKQAQTPQVVLTYYQGKGQTLAWPQDVQDDTLNETLLRGTAPEHLTFALETWGRLRSISEWQKPQTGKNK